MSAELDGFLGIINKLLAFLGSSGEGRPRPRTRRPDRPPGTTGGPLRDAGPGLALSRIRFGRDPVRAQRAHLRHRRRLDGECDEVLWFEIAQVGLAARAGEGLRLHRQHAQVVREAASAVDRVEVLLQFRILCRDACGVETAWKSS